MSILPTTTLELAFGLIGGGIGLLYSFYPFESPRKGTAFRRSPKVQGLLWAVGVGLLVTGFGDFKSTFQLGVFDRAGVVSIFMVWCIFAIIVGNLSVIVFIICAGRRLRKRSWSGLTIEWHSMHGWLDYMMFGYKYYREQLHGALKEEDDAGIMQILERSAASAHATAGLLLLYHNELQHPGQGWREKGIQLTLTRICQVVEDLAPPTMRESLSIKANYMTAELYPDSEEDFAYPIWYKVFDDPIKYSHVLILRQYADDTVPTLFALPVDLDPDSLSLLPGAPEAFKARKEHVINTNDPDIFRSGVPQKIKEEIAGYFSKQDFTSFMSVPIVHHSDDAIGIVNIESNKVNIIEGDNRKLTILAKTLHPYCIILGLLLVTEREGQNAEVSC